MSDRCSLEGCENKRARGRRWCDKHRAPLARPAMPALKGGEPVKVELSAKAEAQRHVQRAMARLAANIDVGPPSAQISAARTILGVAGVELAPDTKVKHVHETKALPAGVSVADLVALMRGLAGQQPPTIDVTRPQTGHDVAVIGPMAKFANLAIPTAPAADDPNGACADGSPEIIEEFPRGAPDGPLASGSVPDGPEGES